MIASRSRAALSVALPSQPHRAGALRRRHPAAHRGLRTRRRLSDRAGARHHLRAAGVGQPDHRSGGRLPRHRLRPPRPRPQRCSPARQLQPDFLAADLDAVLAATLAPGERAVIAGHSMGGIAITSWAQRYPQRVSQCADAVALINTTTGDLLRDVQVLPVPAPLAAARVRAAGRCSSTSAPRGAAFGAAAAASSSRRSRSAATPTPRSPTSSSSCSPPPRPPVAAAGPGARRFARSPGTSPRRASRCRRWSSAATRPAAAAFRPGASPRTCRTWPFVELSGGHCAILEQPDEVNHSCAGSPSRCAGSDGSARSRMRGDLGGRTLPRPDRTVEEARPFVGGLGARPEDRRRPGVAARARSASTSPAAPRRWGRLARIPLRPNSGRRSRSACARRRRTARRSSPARAPARVGRQRVERARVGEPQQHARTRHRSG